MALSPAFAQANMMADLQLLSVGAAEASPTSLVITDKDRCVVVVVLLPQSAWQSINLTIDSD